MRAFVSVSVCMRVCACACVHMHACVLVCDMWVHFHEVYAEASECFLYPSLSSVWTQNLSEPGAY